MAANAYNFIYTVTSRALGRTRYPRGTKVVSEIHSFTTPHLLTREFYTEDYTV